MRWAALALATVGVLALLWIGGEMHYQSCIKDSSTYVGFRGGVFEGEAEPARGIGWEDGPRAAITKRSDCSHFPF